MHFVDKEPSQKRLDFDNKLKSKKILRVPGAYNPLTAKLIECTKQRQHEESGTTMPFWIRNRH